MMEPDTVPTGLPDERGAYNQIPNPKAYTAQPGDEIALPPDEYERFRDLGFVRAVDEPDNLPSAPLDTVRPRSGYHVGNVNDPRAA